MNINLQGYLKIMENKKIAYFLVIGIFILTLTYILYKKNIINGIIGLSINILVIIGYYLVNKSSQN